MYMRKTFLTLLILAAIAPATAMAQIIGKDITVSVTPDHKDWVYAKGEKSCSTWMYANRGHCSTTRR